VKNKKILILVFVMGGFQVATRASFESDFSWTNVEPHDGRVVDDSNLLLQRLRETRPTLRYVKPVGKQGKGTVKGSKSDGGVTAPVVQEPVGIVVDREFLTKGTLAKIVGMGKEDHDFSHPDALFLPNGTMVSRIDKTSRHVLKIQGFDLEIRDQMKKQRKTYQKLFSGLTLEQKQFELKNFEVINSDLGWLAKLGKNSITNANEIAKVQQRIRKLITQMNKATFDAAAKSGTAKLADEGQGHESLALTRSVHEKNADEGVPPSPRLAKITVRSGQKDGELIVKDLLPVVIHQAEEIATAKVVGEMASEKEKAAQEPAKIDKALTDIARLQSFDSNNQDSDELNKALGYRYDEIYGLLEVAFGPEFNLDDKKWSQNSDAQEVKRLWKKLTGDHELFDQDQAVTKLPSAAPNHDSLELIGRTERALLEKLRNVFENRLNPSPVASVAPVRSKSLDGVVSVEAELPPSYFGITENPLSSLSETAPSTVSAKNFDNEDITVGGLHSALEPHKNPQKVVRPWDQLGGVRRVSMGEDDDDDEGSLEPIFIGAEVTSKKLAEIPTLNEAELEKFSTSDLKLLRELYTQKVSNFSSQTERFSGDTLLSAQDIVEHQDARDAAQESLKISRETLDRLITVLKKRPDLEVKPLFTKEELSRYSINQLSELQHELITASVGLRSENRVLFAEKFPTDEDQLEIYRLKKVLESLADASRLVNAIVREREVVVNVRNGGKGDDPELSLGDIQTIQESLASEILAEQENVRLLNKKLYPLNVADQKTLNQLGQRIVFLQDQMHHYNDQIKEKKTESEA
jgi:hypothetical protein